MPDVAVATILGDGVDDRLDRVDLIGPHHQQLLLACDQNHVPADRLAERALHQESFGEAVEMDDLLVVDVREFIDRQEALFRVESEMAGVVVREIERPVSIADDEQLKEAQYGLGIAVARIVLVLDDLLHGAPRAYPEGLQFDLNDGHTVDQENNIIAVVAVVRVDPELVDDLERVLAPVPDVDERVIQRCAIITREVVPLAERAGSRENVRCDDFVKKPLELAIGQRDPIQLFELSPEVRFQGGSVTNIRAILIFQVAQLGDQILFKVSLSLAHRDGSTHCVKHPVEVIGFSRPQSEA